MGATAARVSLLILVSSIALVCRPAQSQQFGQWWWEGSLEASGRSFDNLVDDVGVSEFRQTDLTLSLGLHGFIIHPAVASFRLGSDLLFSSVEGGRDLDTDRSGIRADLGIFPRGSYPLNLSFKRQLYDYVGISQDEPLTLLGVPDTTTSWSGRVRARRGPFKGLLLGFEHSSLEFLEDRSGDEIQGRQFADWSSAGERLNHHLRLEHQGRDFGRVDLELEDLIFNWDEHGDITGRWRWDFSTVATQRGVRFQDLPETQIDIYRALSQLIRTTAKGDVLTLSYNGGLSSGSTSFTTDSHSLGARYQWRRHQVWQITAFGDYALQRSGDTQLRAPQAGAAVSWRRRAGSFDLALTGSGSYRLIDRQGVEGQDSAVATSLLANVGFGDEGRLRTDLEGSVSRNELRSAGEAVTDVPDLGIRLAGVGTQDRYRGRLTLRRRFRKLSTHAYSEWTRRESSEAVQRDDFMAETFVHSLEVTNGRLNLLGNVGENRLESEAGSEQFIRFQAVSASYRPWRWLALRASYRTDQRDFDLGPDIDAERSEAGLDFHLGALALGAHAFETKERFTTGVTRTNRGLRWTVRRRFAGLLPIVSAPGRRGEVKTARRQPSGRGGAVVSRRDDRSQDHGSTAL